MGCEIYKAGPDGDRPVRSPTAHVSKGPVFYRFVVSIYNFFLFILHVSLGPKLAHLQISARKKTNWHVYKLVEREKSRNNRRKKAGVRAPCESKLTSSMTELSLHQAETP